MSKQPTSKEISKAIAFQQYIKTRKLIEYNLNYPIRSMRNYRKALVPTLRKRAEQFETEYPDFAEVFKKHFPDVD